MRFHVYFPNSITEKKRLEKAITEKGAVASLLWGWPHSRVLDLLRALEKWLEKNMSFLLLPFSFQSINLHWRIQGGARVARPLWIQFLHFYGEV